jgi:CRISPR-associated protein Csb1
MTITLEQLRAAVGKDAAIRRLQKLQPVGGPGDKIFPPTYPGERNNDPPRHVFEMRRIGDKNVLCKFLPARGEKAAW